MKRSPEEGRRRPSPVRLAVVLGGAALTIGALLASVLIVSEGSGSHPLPPEAKVTIRNESNTELAARFASAEQSLAAMRLELDALSARHLSMASQLDSEVEAKRAQPPVPDASDSSDPGDRPEAYRAARERAERQLSDQLYLLDDVLASEDPDPRWSRDAEETLTRSASEISEDFRVNDTRCGSNLCRLELRTDASEPVSWDPVRAFLIETPWPAVAFFDFDELEGFGTIYLAREGYSLPVAVPE